MANMPAPGGMDIGGRGVGGLVVDYRSVAAAVTLAVTFCVAPLLAVFLTFQEASRSLGDHVIILFNWSPSCWREAEP